MVEFEEYRKNVLDRIYFINYMMYLIKYKSHVKLNYLGVKRSTYGLFATVLFS